MLGRRAHRTIQQHDAASFMAWSRSAMSTASTTCSTANPMLGPLLRTMHRSLASADQCALRRDATMLVLVSGGSDSVGLLRLAAALRSRPT